MKKPFVFKNQIMKIGHLTLKQIKMGKIRRIEWGFFFFLPLPYGLAACTSHKCSLNDHNSSVTISAKMSTVLVRREDELYADIRYVTVEQSIYKVLLSIADRKIICLSRLGRHVKGFLYKHWGDKRPNTKQFDVFKTVIFEISNQGVIEQSWTT